MKEKGGEEVDVRKCPRCGREIPLMRYKLGFPFCIECTPQTRVREVSIAVTSLHWI